MSYDHVVILLDEARQLIHRSIAAVDSLHAEIGVTAPMRAVLEYLDREGPTTVSEIARTRGVSRQHIQAIVNDLGDRVWIERHDNPRHQRSPLIALTPAGAQTIDRILEVERRAFAPALAHLAAADLDLAAEVVRSVRIAIQQHQEEDR